VLGLCFAVLAAVGCGSSTSGGGTGGTSGSGGTGGGTGGASGGVTYDSDIKAIFMAKCTPCHMTGGSASIFHTMASSYDTVTMNSNACPGKKKGECAAIRVHKGEMPYMKGCSGDPTMDTAKTECLTAAEEAKLDAWVANGLKEK
jgi:hypothetical protein